MKGSSGAALSVYSYYDFLSGKLQLKECVFTDGNDHPENPWFYSTSNPYEDYSNPISEEEARNVMNKYVYETIPYTFLMITMRRKIPEKPQPHLTENPQKSW